MIFFLNLGDLIWYEKNSIIFQCLYVDRNTHTHTHKLYPAMIQQTKIQVEKIIDVDIYPLKSHHTILKKKTKKQEKSNQIKSSIFKWVKMYVRLSQNDDYVLTCNDSWNVEISDSI